MSFTPNNIWLNRIFRLIARIVTVWNANQGSKIHPKFQNLTLTNSCSLRGMDIKGGMP